MYTMKCFPCTSRKFKNTNPPALLKQDIEDKNNGYKHYFGLKVFDILCFLCNQESLVQSKFITDAIIQTNTSYCKCCKCAKNSVQKLNTFIKFNIPTSNLGHNNVSVLYRQAARHINKYEKLQMEFFIKLVSPDEKMPCQFFGSCLFYFSYATKD